ncbi:MAG: PEP-CTERM sorting domain-containing protein [Pseudomonadota bacterium]
MRKTFVLATVLLAALSSASARSSVITPDLEPVLLFSGLITNFDVIGADPGVSLSVGDPFSGSFSLAGPLETMTFPAGAAAPAVFSIDFPGFGGTVTETAQFFSDQTVGDDDFFVFVDPANPTISDLGFLWEIILSYDPNETFEGSLGSFSLEAALNDGAYSVSGSITDATFFGLPDSTEVPVPGSLPLLVAALAGFALRKRQVAT